MDQQPIEQSQPESQPKTGQPVQQERQSQDTRTYFPLGPKTLALLVFKRAMCIIVLFLGLIALAAIRGSVPDILGGFMDTILNFGLVAVLGFSFFICLAAWLEYQHYGVILEPENFRIKRGVIAQTEVGIPYRRIKEVNLDRGIFEQMFGVSTVVITLLGEGEGQRFQDESEIDLPLIEQSIAQEIQNCILEKGGHYSSNA